MTARYESSDPDTFHRTLDRALAVKPRTIHKFPVPVGDVIRCDIRAGGRIVHVAMQDSEPALWIEVDPSARDEARSFQAFATGQSIPQGLRYVGTAEGWPSPFVWHVYEVTP